MSVFIILGETGLETIPVGLFCTVTLDTNPLLYRSFASYACMGYNALNDTEVCKGFGSSSRLGLPRTFEIKSDSLSDGS